MTDSVTVWSIRIPHWRAEYIRPVVLAESWGSEITAPEAVEQMFGCIPFPWWQHTDVRDTPGGLAKRLARMHDPERLFAARQERIRKRMADKDPLFYDQLIGPALENDVYNLEHYQNRQKEIADMHRHMAVKPDQVGKLWISPEAERLKQFDWPEMATRLRDMVVAKINVYEAQERILKMDGVI
jgi:hypothetical protein